MSLGPNRSFRFPIKMLEVPCTRKHRDAAPEMVALDQANSFIKGSKNIPKLLQIPQAMTWMKKPAAMMA